jgi:hypothetical protein
MGRRSRPADVKRMPLRPLLAILVAALSLVALVGAATKATAGRACLTGASDRGYSYAGHQAASRGNGVRATITPTRTPSVAAGHAAGWVGVGGPGQGVDGGDAWIQAGIASVRRLGMVVYVEIAREGHARALVLVERDVPVGRPYRIAVRELADRPGWWQVWIDGDAVTRRIRVPGSSGRWAPIATAESWNGGTPSCNEFGFRFERVSVSHAVGGSWRPFVSGHRFLDGTHELRELPRGFVASSG